MTTFSASDHACMARALVLAEHGRYTAHPNPRVGCVLVRDGETVGEGWHRAPGEPHAEINALSAAGSNAAGSTAYVTLEPCSHHGRTPPCTEALLDAGVARVIYAMPDPNPAVSGSDALARAGVDVQCGLLETEARKLNRGFIRRMTGGRPFVRLKTAASLDGRTAMASGESQWITGAEARRDVQRLRAASGAIVTGYGTVAADNPSLTVRDEDTGGRQPIRAVLDSNLRTPASARLVDEAGQTIFFCCNDDRRADFEARGATVERVADLDGRVSIDEVLLNLGRREVNDALVECGPGLSGAFLEAGLVDELVIYMAPHIMGSETRGIADTPGWQALMDRMTLQISDVRAIGNDLRVTATPAR